MLVVMSGDLIDLWNGVDPIWRPAFELAWESFQAGSIGIGAVLVDPNGAIVSAGRNRRNELGGPGQIGGSNLAHAEVNALALLPPGVYTDHVLYTTVEPCLLCISALRLSHVGTVRFATTDPYWDGIDGIVDLNENIAKRWPKREGPLDGPLRTWAMAVPMVDFNLRRTPWLDLIGGGMPEAMAVAQHLISAGDRIKALTLDEAIEIAWPRLVVSPA